MPILSRALARSLDIEDWNIVQNNGARAAQVVPHVHFHYIPRYPEGRVENKRKGNVDVGMLKSWRMFGRGTREELDDEEAVGLSRRIREGLAVEVEEVVKGRGRSAMSDVGWRSVLDGQRPEQALVCVKYCSSNGGIIGVWLRTLDRQSPAAPTGPRK
ncbi:hypothetical protein M8818_006716 [Zalaria obscura]|uniref:Uncharacterized protein n=1 Tax=Zalaria obscura TaxID=2024903 RepID=A0ACC3S559_9PEZI